MSKHVNFEHNFHGIVPSVPSFLGKFCGFSPHGLRRRERERMMQEELMLEEALLECGRRWQQRIAMGIRVAMAVWVLGFWVVSMLLMAGHVFRVENTVKSGRLVVKGSRSHFERFMAPVSRHHVQGSVWVPKCGEMVATAGYMEGAPLCGPKVKIPSLLQRAGYNHYGAPSTSVMGEFYLPLEHKDYVAPLAVRLQSDGMSIQVCFAGFCDEECLH